MLARGDVGGVTGRRCGAVLCGPWWCGWEPHQAYSLTGTVRYAAGAGGWGGGAPRAGTRVRHAATAVGAGLGYAVTCHVGPGGSRGDA